MKEIESKIIKQLNKDLSLAGYPKLCSIDFSMEENINKLNTWISDESKMNFSRFIQFLYSIDLNESCFEAVGQIDHESLTLHVLNRLKNKVINKEKFSNI
jgi:hypothetical protein